MSGVWWMFRHPPFFAGPEDDRGRAGNLVAGDFPKRYGKCVCRGIFVRGNPVTHGHSECPDAWPDLSFGHFVKKNIYAVDWCCGCRGPVGQDQVPRVVGTISGECRNGGCRNIHPTGLKKELSMKKIVLITILCVITVISAGGGFIYGYFVKGKIEVYQTQVRTQADCLLIKSKLLERLSSTSNLNDLIDQVRLDGIGLAGSLEVDRQYVSKETSEKITKSLTLWKEVDGKLLALKKL